MLEASWDPQPQFPPSHREVGKDCSVFGELGRQFLWKQLLRGSALPSQLLLPMHTNGLASHPRQPLPLLSSLSSHTRLGLRSICSPHSRHAHAMSSSPQVHACECTRRYSHLSGSHSPAPTRQNPSIPPAPPSSMTSGSEVGRRGAAPSVRSPPAGWSGWSREVEGGADGEYLGPASLAAGGEGKPLTGRPKSASGKGRAGMPTLGDKMPLTHSGSEAPDSSLIQGETKLAQMGTGA